MVEKCQDDTTGLDDDEEVCTQPHQRPWGIESTTCRVIENTLYSDIVGDVVYLVHGPHALVPVGVCEVAICRQYCNP